MQGLFRTAAPLMARRFVPFQQARHFSLIGKKAPDFTTGAVAPGGQEVHQIKFSEVIKDKYCVLYFYPLDFTYVCTSEQSAFSKYAEEFKKRNTEVIGVSIDSVFTHQAWQKTPLENGGVGLQSHYIASDLSKQISMDYDVLLEKPPVACRGAFIIDNKGIVRAEMKNDLPIGRNVDEVLRLVDAVQHHENSGKVMPANWAPGKPAMEASAKGVAEYMTKHA